MIINLEIYQKIIKDFNPDTLNFETLEKINKIDINSLEIIDNVRIGSCVSKPANFFAIGLNYKAHADETNSDAPKEPIVFNKSPNCIIGPYDNIVIPKFSNSLDHEIEIAIVIGKKAKYVITYLAFFPITIAISISWSKELENLGMTMLSYGPIIQFGDLLNTIGSFGASEFVSSAWAL